MNARTNLKKSVEKRLIKYIPEISEVDEQIVDAERPERRKWKFVAAVASICERIGCTPKDISELADHLLTLPRTPEYAPVLSFVARTKDRALKLLGGDEVPPMSNFVHRDLMADLVMSMQFIQNCNVLKLVAASWEIAGRECPEAFAEGCECPTKHQEMIDKLKEKRVRLVQEAANSLTLEDLEIHVHGPMANCWYADTNREVAASALGNTVGVENLVRWHASKAQQE